MVASSNQLLDHAAANIPSGAGYKDARGGSLLAHSVCLYREVSDEASRAVFPDSHFRLGSRMEIFETQILWGVAVWRVVAAAVLVFLGLLSRKLIAYAFSGYLKRLTENTKAEWDDELVLYVPGPLSALAQIGLW